MGKGDLVGICTCSTNPMIGGRKRGEHWGNCPLYVSPEVSVEKSEGEVLPCHECGSQMVKYEYAVYDVYQCQNLACGMIGKFRNLREHNKPIHPARLAAEGLVRRRRAGGTG